MRIEVVVPPDVGDDLHAAERARSGTQVRPDRAVIAGRGVDVGALSDAVGFASVGRAAAALLTRRLSPTDTMGFTWGPNRWRSPRP